MTADLELAPDEQVVFDVSAWPGPIDFARANRGQLLLSVISIVLFTVALAPPIAYPSLLVRASFTLAALSVAVGIASRVLDLRRTRYVITSARVGVVGPRHARWIEHGAAPAVEPGRVTVAVTWSASPPLRFDLPATELTALRAVLEDLGLVDSPSE